MSRRKPEVVYEDDDLLLVNKPPHLLTIPDRYAPEKPNLFEQLNELYGKVWVVHRLDRETSGLICFAKNEETHRDLSIQFEKRQVQKFYLALVDGHVRPEEGEINKPIGPSPSGTKMQVINNGKSALTTYKVLEYFKNFSWVEVQIHTGRTHQIRVHFQYIGHPLAVDVLYGQRNGFYLSEIKRRRYNLAKEKEERPLTNRSTLHAARLQLTHPRTKSPLNIEAPLPKDLSAILNQLRKWGN